MGNGRSHYWLHPVLYSTHRYFLPLPFPHVVQTEGDCQESKCFSPFSADNVRFNERLKVWWTPDSKSLCGAWPHKAPRHGWVSKAGAGKLLLAAIKRHPMFSNIAELILKVTRNGFGPSLLSQHILCALENRGSAILAVVVSLVQLSWQKRLRKDSYAPKLSVCYHYSYYFIVLNMLLFIFKALGKY